MKADRLEAVLRIRGLVERRRLAERAAAARAADASRHGHAAALEARAAAIATPGTWLSPLELRQVRTGAIALDDAVTRCVDDRRDAERALVDAERALTAAAVERRSAERLRDRREAAAARHERRLDERRADEVALQQWRTHR